MKRFFLFAAVLLTSLCTNAQKYMVVHQGDFVTRFKVEAVDYVDFEEIVPEEEDTTAEDTTAVDTAEHEWVDLGLPSGTLWATCNIGAENPEDYGDYFAWGETTGYNSGKTAFSWSTYTLCNGSSSTMTKYCTDSGYGTVDNKTELDPEDDAATANWGSNWRMPSKTQQDELRTECTWTWTTQNNVYGYKVTGTNGNSIFLPAAGFRYNSDLYFAGSYGYYWSRTLYSDRPDYAYGLHFDSSYVSTDYFNRYDGRSVRPVLSAQN